MIKCVGVIRKEGSMVSEGRNVEWDSVRFSIINDNVPGNFGSYCEVVKIKKEDYHSFTGRNYSDYREFVDKEVSLEYFNDEGKMKLCGFRLVSPDSSNVQPVKNK